MGWGMQIAGLANVMGMFDNLEASIGDSGTVYFVGTNVEYSIYVELGTSKMSAQPYIRPAVEEFNRGPMAYIQKHQPGANPSSTEELVKVSALALERDIAERAPVDTGNLQASIKAVKG
jgi:hypothetical protein